MTVINYAIAATIAAAAARRSREQQSQIPAPIHPNPRTMTATTIAFTAPARVESGIPAAYRLIRRGDGNGNMIPVLQGLFTWTEATRRGTEWRDLETQDEPYVEDSIPFGPINY